MASSMRGKRTAGLRSEAARTLTLLGVGALLLSACYLPRADVERSIESQVLVAVYRCSETVVSGEITNKNDVPVAVLITPRWMDASRVPFHEVEIEPVEIPATATVEWEAQATAEIERPQFCEAETVSTTEVG